MEMKHHLDIVGDPDVADLIRRALEEDVQSGDASSLAVVGAEDACRAAIVSRGEYVVAGILVAAAVFQAVEPGIETSILAPDGSAVRRGDLLATLDGSARGVLTGERTALNFLQRLSGIATLTRAYVEQVEESNAVVLDTRKTTPTLRKLEKYAVRCGGGENHRMGLHDRVMLKDNHLAQWRKSHAGTLADMVAAAAAACPGLEVEVEVESVEDFQVVLEARPDWILLDNMPVEAMRSCVELCRGRAKLEASGGVTLDTIGEIAKSGVDAVSVGALTHSAVAADFSLEFDS